MLKMIMALKNNYNLRLKLLKMIAISLRQVPKDSKENMEKETLVDSQEG